MSTPPLKLLVLDSEFSSYEHSRLEDQAAGLVEMMHGQDVHAPVINPLRIVDVGCGTGIQSCLLGKAYPNAQVYGVDLSAVPDRSKPTNVQFIEGDILKLINNNSKHRFEANSIDLIFSRLLILGMTDWQGYVNGVASRLKPGAWAEMQDYDFDWHTYPEGKICSDSWSWLAALREAKNWDFNCGTNIKTYMEKAGFVNIQQIQYLMPCGTWLARQKPETKRIGAHSGREYGTLFHHVISKQRRSGASTRTRKL